nr:cytochrome P450 4C1-like [Onthophagus taurus]
MWHILFGLSIVFLFYYFTIFIKWRKNIYNDIEKIPGPKTYPLIGTLYHFFGAQRHDIYRILAEITAKYKPFYRMWNARIPEIHIMKPDHVEQIMSSSVQIRKGSRYRFVKRWLGDGLLLSDGAKWHQRRKLITPTFHFKILENFMDVFSENSNILIDHLETKCDGVGFDVYPYITHCTLDIICETAMGVSINAMTDRNSNYAKAIYRTTQLVIKRIFSAIQQTPLYPLMESGKAFETNLKIMHDFTDKVIKERRKLLNENPLPTENTNDVDFTMKKKRLSFLNLLLDKSYNLSDGDIREEVDTFMFAGHDTTTGAICWSLFVFANNPDIQEKVYEEVKNVLHDKKVPTAISELNEMRYLECCIKETLRLYPSVPNIGRSIVEDITLDGYRIPKGSDCIIHIFDSHRNPEIFPNPEKFDPDRFLPENSIKRHPYAYIPFSAGPRNCIGQKFAMYEEKTLLASIIRSFKILPVDTMDSVKLKFELILRPVDGMKIRLEKRTD